MAKSRMGQTVGAVAVTTMLQGYNTFSGSACGMALQGNVGNNNPNSGCNYTVCTDFYHLMEALNISAAASVMFGGDSVDAKAQFAQNLNLTTYSVTIAVYANHVSESLAAIGGTVNITPPSDMNEFFQEYGDSWVSQLDTGSEYIATYVFYAQSLVEQQSITDTLKAYGIVDGGTFSVDLQSAFTKVQQQVTTGQLFRQMITGFQNPNMPEADKVVEYALNFSSLKPDAPAAISYTTNGYEEGTDIVSYYPNFQAIVANRNMVLGSGTQVDLTADAAQLSTVQNQIKWLNQVYAIYNYQGDSDLTTKAQQVSEDIADLNNLIQEIKEDPTQTYTPGKYRSLSYGSPVFTCVLTTPVAWGGTGGDPFTDITPASMPLQMLLTELQSHGGEEICELVCTYTYTTGSIQEPTQETITVKHGSLAGGSLSTPLYLQYGQEFVTELSGMSGDYVNQLTITPNEGSPLTWPPKPDKTTPFGPWSVPSGSVLVGFQGRSHDHLNQLAPIVCSFSPATWEAFPSSQ